MAALKKRKIPGSKVRAVKEMVDLLKKYRGILLVSITSVPAPVLHEIRAKLREQGALLKVVKNTLFRKAIEEISAQKPGVDKLVSFLTGQNAVLLTNENPFLVRLFLDRNKVAREARAGDVAPREIVVSEGNTNFAPGPIISLFNKVGIPTTIKEGSVWVVKDTVVAKEGDVISADLADLLKRLGIKPIEVGVDVKAGYVDGLVISGEELQIDLGEYEAQLRQCVQEAFNLSINAVYPTSDTVAYIVAKAHYEATVAAVEASFPSAETLPHILAKSEAQAQALYDAVAAKSDAFK